MANDLPNPCRGCIHLQRHHVPIIQALRCHIVAVIVEPVAMHVEDVRGASERIDVPDDRVIGTHVERGVVRENPTVERVETGRLRGGQGDGWHVCQLRPPVRLIASMVHLEQSRHGHRGRICRRVVHAQVGLSEETHRFVKRLVQEHKLAMRSHGSVHGAAVVHDSWTGEAGIHVDKHVDVGVVCPHLRVRARVWSCAFIDEPFVDKTLPWSEGIATGRSCVPSCQGGWI